jgi:hypothetical protein|tara:strand:+ start:406 stop:1134 length:729 start_codon:yes stop_codon:yes gene_type:complete
MLENNCITINFPQGSGGHMLGRMISCCDNVAWYDHEQNNKHPWLPYTANDSNFSKMHYNKRFKGAKPKGLDPKFTIPPVLDFAESRGITTTPADIQAWKKKLYPKQFVYTLHDDLDTTKKFFNPAKYIVVIPNDIELLIERWMRSSYYYFVDPKNTDYLYRDLYNDKARQQGITLKQVLLNDFEKQIANYKQHSTDDDVVITEINDILQDNVYEEVCTKLGLVINKLNYEKCKELFNSRSHL